MVCSVRQLINARDVLVVYFINNENALDVRPVSINYKLSNCKEMLYDDHKYIFKPTSNSGKFFIEICFLCVSNF